MSLPDSITISTAVVVEDEANPKVHVASGCEPHRIPPDSPEPCPFRLFKIDGFATDSTLDLTLLEGEPCHNVKEHAALSYAWEGQTRDRIVYCNGHQALITESLRAFLTVLLEKYGPNNFYWADQLCISQAGSSDKERQIPLMDTYFSQAQEILIWLGPSTTLTDLCFDMMTDVVKILHKPITNPDSYIDRHFLGALGCRPEVEDRFWHGVSELCNRVWWHRVWTTQEFILAKRADFYCGSRSGNVKELLEAIIEANDKRPILALMDIEFSVMLNVLPLGLLGEFQPRSLGLGLPVELPIWWLMQLARGKKSSQEVDKVFGLLSICRTAARDNLKVRYQGRGYWTTWIRWAHYGLQEDRGWRLLISDPWLRHQHLPSWCPNLNSPHSTTEVLYWHFQAGDPTEVKDESSQWPFPLAVTIDEKGLICNGLLVDTVKEVTRLQIGENVDGGEQYGPRDVDEPRRYQASNLVPYLQRAWVLAHKPSDKTERAFTDYLRTITNDRIRDPDQTRPTDAELGQAFQALMNDGEGTEKEKQIRTRGIIGQIELSCRGKSFLTTEDGMMGIGPLDIEAGDLVCIFPKVKVPLIVRRANKDVQGKSIQPIQLEAGKEHIGCMFLGPAFVQGIMYGEAFELCEERGVQDQFFTII